MTGKQAIRDVIGFSHMVTEGYFKDLQDRDLLVRPVPGANHIAWQLGHLISNDHHMLRELGHSAPPLPPGFEEAHAKAQSESNDAARFFAVAEYLRLAQAMQAAKLAAVDATPEADLDKPAPEKYRAYAPTVAALLMLLGTHWLMHAGQFVPVRRALGKPPLF